MNDVVRGSERAGVSAGENGNEGAGHSATQVVLATHNPHKVHEVRRIVDPHIPGLELVGYDGPTPIENGTTFEENALIKARAAAAHTSLPAIADDSGICVDLLGGSPGILSSRWAGPQVSDTENLELLLAQISDFAQEHRGAAFVCAAALVMPAREGQPGQEFVLRREWRGSLLHEPAGAGGFGYDPIFQPEGETRSAAELSPEEKNAMSHRFLAFTALAPVLREHVGGTPAVRENR